MSVLQSKGDVSKPHADAFKRRGILKPLTVHTCMDHGVPARASSLFLGRVPLGYFNGNLGCYLVTDRQTIHSSAPEDCLPPLVLIQTLTMNNIHIRSGKIPRYVCRIHKVLLYLLLQFCTSFNITINTILDSINNTLLFHNTLFFFFTSVYQFIV